MKRMKAKIVLNSPYQAAGVFPGRKMPKSVGLFGLSGRRGVHLQIWRGICPAAGGRFFNHQPNIMIDMLKKALQEASDSLREQAAAFGEGARERGYHLIEEWLLIFPKLEMYGLEVKSFALSVALSPSLDVELLGRHEDFKKERLEHILAETKHSTALTSVFQTIKTAYALHRRTLANLNDPLIVKIRIRIPPEIKVYIGKPTIE